jgi:transcriptional antiterminator NusG
MERTSLSVGRPGRTEGGEASMLIASVLDPVTTGPDAAVAEVPRRASWSVLWTRSHCERLVYDQLASQGLTLFLPEIDMWSRRGGLRHRIRVPMFPGYLFLRAALDKYTYVAVRKARGLVSLLGADEEGAAVVPDAEVVGLQRVVQSRLPAAPHPYLKAGMRVRITRGPLADVEGVLVRTKPTKGMLILSVDLVQKSVAVEVDCTIVTPL